MTPLAEDLQTPKKSLGEFADIAGRVLGYLPNIISNRAETKEYAILSSATAGTVKFARPVNKSLFIEDIQKFTETCKWFVSILARIKNRSEINETDGRTIDAAMYTIAQSIGVGMDFLCNPNSARKHAGNRFEELIRAVIYEIGITQDKIVFKIPYPSDEGVKLYSCETDIILSPHEKVRSDVTSVSEDEIVVSLKTTSKDRMGKIFLDKMLMEKFARHPVKVVGIFLNDVQRKEAKKVSYTFVSGLFMVYTQFLARLEGVYFIDPPPVTLRTPYSAHISRFSRFIIKDVWSLLAA